MSNCTSPNPCQTDSGSVIYTSGNLSCIGANTNDSLSFVLFKLNQKICDLQAQLDECCSSSTTSTTSSTTTAVPCNNPITNIFNEYTTTTTKYIGPCANPGDDLLDSVFSPGGNVVVPTTTTTTTIP